MPSCPSAVTRARARIHGQQQQNQAFSLAKLVVRARKRCVREEHTCILCCVLCRSDPFGRRAHWHGCFDSYWVLTLLMDSEVATIRSTLRLYFMHSAGGQPPSPHVVFKVFSRHVRGQLGLPRAAGFPWHTAWHTM